jgi:hypothetical protein
MVSTDFLQPLPGFSKLDGVLETFRRSSSSPTASSAISVWAQSATSQMGLQSRTEGLTEGFWVEIHPTPPTGYRMGWARGWRTVSLDTLGGGA